MRTTNTNGQQVNRLTEQLIQLVDWSIGQPVDWKKRRFVFC